MSNQESEMEKRVRELSQQVRSLERKLFGVVVFFYVTMVFLVGGQTLLGSATVFPILAVGLYYILLVFQDRRKPPKSPK